MLMDSHLAAVTHTLKGQSNEIFIHSFIQTSLGHWSMDLYNFAFSSDFAEILEI